MGLTDIASCYSYYSCFCFIPPKYGVIIIGILGTVSIIQKTSFISSALHSAYKGGKLIENISTELTYFPFYV